MTARRIVVVDVETTGLRPTDICVEVAWWDLSTDERGSFVPRHDMEWVAENGHPDALVLNGYADRIAITPMDDGAELRRLHHALRGQRLAGSNPAFDAGHVARLFTAGALHPDPWHHRLLDLSAYAAGVLGLDPGDLPGCAGVCDLLGIPAGDHSAQADVTATGLAFKALMAKAGVTLDTKEAAA